MFAGLVPIPEGTPWFYLDEEQSRHFTAELKREVGPEHILSEWHEKLLVIAKCAANDDVLVAVDDDFRRFFWVHLTFSGKIDQFPESLSRCGSSSQFRPCSIL